MPTISHLGHTIELVDEFEDASFPHGVPFNCQLAQLPPRVLRLTHAQWRLAQAMLKQGVMS